MAAPVAIVVALFCFALTPLAQAAPTHLRSASLDIAGLDHACGAAVDNKGDVYASSPGESKVKIFNPAHAEIGSIANANEPCGLAVDSKGNLYVSEKATGKVLKYVPTAYPFVGAPSYGAPVTIDSSGNAKGIAVDRVEDRLYVAEGTYVAVYKSNGSLEEINEMQQVVVSSATGGTFKLKFKGQETTPIKFDASDAEVKAALEALSTIGAGAVEVEKPGGFYFVTFVGALAHTDVEMLGTDSSGLTGAGAKVTVTESTKGFNGHVGEGSLTQATGVAAYNYTYRGGSPANSNRFHHYHLFVADAASDEIQIFAAREGTPLKLRKTIKGVDQDANPETPEQKFNFGTAGAYLAADPGNENPETRVCTQVPVGGENQACTAGHFFLYDAGNGALDEFDATGEFLTQVTNASFADAEPTALAVERSGLSSDGTLYVGAGASAGAKLLAFAPLVMPTRLVEPKLSRAQSGTRAVATDCNGYVYVAAETKVRVFDPQGTELTSFEDPEPLDVAADCSGNVYVVDGPAVPVFTYYTPSKYPPEAGTTYTRHEPTLISGGSGAGMVAVAVNPANGHAFVLGDNSFAPVMVEFAPPSEGSKVEGQCGVGLGLATGRLDIGVYGTTGEVYVTANLTNLAAVKCGAQPELLRARIRGGGCPSGEFGSNPAIAIDQSNGHILQFQPGQDGNSAREYDSSGACVAQFGVFSNTAGNYKVAVDNSCFLHDPPLTEATTPTCADTYPSNGTVYVASDGLDNGVQPYDVTAFGPLNYGEAPSAVTGVASNFGPGNATLNGMVNPNTFELEECVFEYLSEEKYEENGKTFAGAESEECAESLAEIGKGSKPIAVHADIVGIEPESERYRFRLLTENKYGESDGGTGLFGPPLLTTQRALPVGYDEATLRAQVDPSGLATKYHFEYGTEEGVYDQSTPVDEVPSGDGPVGIEVPVTGLVGGTTYHFRVVVANDAKTIAGPDQTLETLKRAQSQDCENAEYRTGFGAFLPDCRAYELVTPAQTQGPPGAISHGSGRKFFNSWFVAPRGPGAGESVAFGASVAGVDGNAFRAQRGDGAHPKEGWTNEVTGFSFAQSAKSQSPHGLSSDQRYWFLDVTGLLTPTKLSFPVANYLRTPSNEASAQCRPEPNAQFDLSDPEHHFELVGCGSLGTDLQAEGRYLSTGGTHVIFTSQEQLEENSPSTGLAIYDRQAGQTSAEVISVKPDGSPFEGGEAPTYVATSEDGSAVVFQVGGALYVHREDTTTQVAAAPNTYAGVSENGSRVFYMDKTFPVGLENPVPPAGLFACDVDAGPCAGPEKTHEPIAIANNSVFVNVSPDGSHVFFTSEEDLGSPGEENENGEEAEATEPNLYAWDGTAVAFVAILHPQDLVSFRKGPVEEEEESLEDLLQWTRAIPGQKGSGSGIGRAYSPTRSTPDGEVLIFQSHAQLTGYDNDEKGEIYRYDPGAVAGTQLACVSCDPSGAPHDSTADTRLQTVFEITRPDTLIPNVTDDGKRVFFESREALLPEDANEVTDVYEWKAQGTEGPGGDVCEHLGGCLALISTGQGEEHSYLYGMSADGEDVFFETLEKLVGADVSGSFSIYDARSLGGIPDPPAKELCQGDACQGQGSTPPALAVPATTGSGEALQAQKTSCGKGKHRVKGRCVKKQSKSKKKKHRRKHSNKKRANHNRGASR